MHVVVEALGAGIVVCLEEGEEGGSLFLILTLAVVELGGTGAMLDGWRTGTLRTLGRFAVCLCIVWQEWRMQG